MCIRDRVIWPVKILSPNDLYCVEWDVKPYSTQACISTLDPRVPLVTVGLAANCCVDDQAADLYQFQSQWLLLSTTLILHLARFTGTLSALSVYTMTVLVTVTYKGVDISVNDKHLTQFLGPNTCKSTTAFFLIPLHKHSHEANS